MSDFKVGMALGGILGAFVAGIMIRAPDKGPDTVEFIKVPTVVTKEVAGSTVYKTLPYPEVCTVAADNAHKAFNISRRMARDANFISVRINEGLYPHAVMQEPMISDVEYINRKSDSMVRGMYLWHDYDTFDSQFAQCKEQLNQSDD